MVFSFGSFPPINITLRDRPYLQKKWGDRLKKFEILKNARVFEKKLRGGRDPEVG